MCHIFPSYLSYFCLPQTIPVHYFLLKKRTQHEPQFIAALYTNLPLEHQCSQTFYKLHEEVGIQCHPFVVEA